MTGRSLPRSLPCCALAVFQSARTSSISAPLPISRPNSVRLTTVAPGTADCDGKADVRVPCGAHAGGPGANTTPDEGLGQGWGAFAIQSGRAGGLAGVSVLIAGSDSGAGMSLKLCSSGSERAATWLLMEPVMS